MHYGIESLKYAFNVDSDTKKEKKLDKTRDPREITRIDTEEVELTSNEYLYCLVKGGKVEDEDGRQIIATTEIFRSKDGKTWENFDLPQKGLPPELVERLDYVVELLGFGSREELMRCVIRRYVDCYFKPRRVVVEAGSALPLDGGVKCLEK